MNIFKKHGLNIWGGDWNSPIDYHHFQTARPEKLPKTQASLLATEDIIGKSVDYDIKDKSYVNDNQLKELLLKYYN